MTPLSHAAKSGAAATATATATAAAANSASADAAPGSDAFAALMDNLATAAAAVPAADDAGLPGAARGEPQPAAKADGDGSACLPQGAGPGPAVLLPMLGLLLPAAAAGTGTAPAGDRGGRALPGRTCLPAVAGAAAKDAAQLQAAALLQASDLPAVVPDKLFLATSPSGLPEDFLRSLKSASPDRPSGAADGAMGALQPAYAGFTLALDPPDAAAPIHQASLPSHPLDAAFAGDLTAEVRLLVDSGVQQAELRLNPAELGPIHIQLNISSQTADISFSAAHSMTRDSIEQSLPALREMLAGQGLSLGKAGVSSGQDGRAFGQGAGKPSGTTSSVASPAGVQATSMVLTGVATVRSARGMLDLYA